MKLKQCIIAIGIIMAPFVVAPFSRAAAVSISDPAATLTLSQARETDPRVDKLELYLQSYDSPLTSEAQVFVSEADRHNLDWKLVAAIAGVESTFGKHIPNGSFNGWGWGIPTGADHGVAFQSWADGIAQVSEGLRKNYMDKGATTIEEIGAIYAASPAWPWKVHAFIDQIDAFSPKSPHLIPLSLE